MFKNIRPLINIVRNAKYLDSYSEILNLNRVKNMRWYLSPAYACSENWKERRNDPFIKDIKPVEFYYELLRKYKRENKISSIDVDIFLNSISEEKVEEFLDEIEEVVRLLRRSPETINTFPSTPHAAIRLLLNTKKYDLLFKLLTDPMNYGIFLDYYLANLLMNTFIMENNFMAASRIGALLMLQEDYGPPLTKSLVLLSCLKYICNTQENQPWIDYHPVIEPEEEVKVLVNYVRNPYFDDHFDLKDPQHLVGKTLAWLSFCLENQVMKTHSEILGWSLYQKWNELEHSVKRLINENQQLDQIIFDKVSEQIATCVDEERKSKLTSLMEEVKDKNLISEIGIIDKAEEYVRHNSSKYESDSVKYQINAYSEWMKNREEAVKKQLEMIERNKLIEEIEEKKKDLEEREDVIFFFEKKNQFDLLMEKREEYLKEHEPYYKEKHSKAEEEEYIPPEV